MPDEVLAKILMQEMGPMASMPRLEDWGDEMIESAKHLLARDGHVTPVFMFLAPSPHDPTQVVQGVLSLHDFLSADGLSRDEVHEKRDAMAELLPSLLTKFRAFASVMITEAWARRWSTRQSLEEAKAQTEATGGLKNVEGRLEVLMTLFETKTIHRSRMWRIDRDEANNPSLGEEVKGPRDTGGRFAAFLHAAPSGEMN